MPKQLKGLRMLSEGRHSVSNTDLLDDNCIWISPGPSDRLPRAGTFKGKHEIANFLAQVGANLEFSEFAPREMIEQGRPWWFWEHSQVEQKDREGSKERMGARF
jgi:hypothetical protein